MGMGGVRESSVLNRAVRKDLDEKLTRAMTESKRKGRPHGCLQENSKCKDPEVRASLLCLETVRRPVWLEQDHKGKRYPDEAWELCWQV